MDTIPSPITLLASAARTATAGTNGDSVTIPRVGSGLQFVLDVTAAATDDVDTLDVYVQTKIDDTNWVDVLHFTQCLGNGSVKRWYTKLLRGVAQATFENATALGSGAQRELFGRDWRVRWVIVDADEDGGFTFSVKAAPI